MNKKTLTKKEVSLDRYAGKWVAFVNEKIVAWADSLKELDKKIQEKALSKKASYFLVPRKDEGPYVLRDNFFIPFLIGFAEKARTLFLEKVE